MGRQPARAKRGKESKPHLHQGELFLTGIVVAGGTLILLSIVRAILVGVLSVGCTSFHEYWCGHKEGDIHTGYKMLIFWSY